MKTKKIVASAVALALVALWCFPAGTDADMTEIYKPITTAISGTFKGITKDQRKAIIKGTVEMMQLDVFKDDVADLYDDVNLDDYMGKVVTCAARNQFLNSFIGVAAWRDEPFFSGKADANRMVPAAVLYSVVLDRMTRAARKDPKVLRKLFDHYEAFRGAHPEWKEYVTAFEIAKTVTVGLGVQALVTNVEAGRVDHDTGRRTIPLNIVEACLEDFRLGFGANARAGLSIAFEAPGQPKFEESTGEGPTVLTKDKKALLFNPPLPKLWADLYQTWNMAFVSHYDNNLFFFAKLMNPSVGCYDKEPGEYLYTRGTALYMHIHYEIFRRLKAKSREPDMKWSDPTLTRLWAEHNEFVAQSYQDELVAKKEHPDGWYKTGLKRVLGSFSLATGTTIEVLGGFIRKVTALPNCDALTESELYTLAADLGDVVAGVVSALFGDWSAEAEAHVEPMMSL